MAILGIDYGDKKLGIAKSAANDTIAVPIGTISNSSAESVITKLQDICAEEQVSVIVVGMPSDQQGEKTQKFVELLKEHLNITIATIDERFSTQEAKKLQQQSGDKSDDDPIAAMLILQTYLDRQ